MVISFDSGDMQTAFQFWCHFVVCIIYDDQMDNNIKSYSDKLIPTK